MSLVIKRKDMNFEKLRDIRHQIVIGKNVKKSKLKRPFALHEKNIFYCDFQNDEDLDKSLELLKKIIINSSCKVIYLEKENYRIDLGLDEFIKKIEKIFLNTEQLTYIINNTKRAFEKKLIEKNIEIIFLNF